MALKSAEVDPRLAADVRLHLAGFYLERGQPEEAIAIVQSTLVANVIASEVRARTVMLIRKARSSQGLDPDGDPGVLSMFEDLESSPETLADLGMELAELLATLLDGRREAAFDGITDALRQGTQPQRIVDCLVIAASERILRFDEQIDADPTIQNGWLTVTHGLTYAHAVRCALSRLPEPAMLSLLYFAARIINATQRLARPKEERFRLHPDKSLGTSLEDCDQATAAGRPQEALSVVANWLEQGGDISALRSWALDLALSDKLTRPLVVGHLIKTTCAAFTEHEHLQMAGSERALLPIQAVLRLAASPIRERHVARLTHEALRFVVAGKVPRSLI